MRSGDERRPARATPGSDDPALALSGAGSGPRAVGVTLLVLHLCLTGWLALHAVPNSWAYEANLTPFASVHRALLAGSPGEWHQLLGPIAAAAPLGLLLPLAGGRLRAAWLPSFLRTVGAALVIATALEFLRTSLGGWILNVDDVLLGVIGAGLVHLALVPAGRAVLRDRADAAARGPRTAPVVLPAAPPVPPAPPTPAPAPPTPRASAAPAPRTPAAPLSVAPRPLSLVKPGR